MRRHQPGLQESRIPRAMFIIPGRIIVNEGRLGKGGVKLDNHESIVGRIVSAIIIGTALLCLLFSREYAALDPYDPDPVWVKKTWWGLKNEEIRLRWMKPPGEDYESWCAKSPEGEWYTFIVEYDEPEPEPQY